MKGLKVSFVPILSMLLIVMNLFWIPQASAMNGAYMASLFQKEPNVLEATLPQIPGSVTTDYILFSLYVDSNADIHDVQGKLIASNGEVEPSAISVYQKVIEAGKKQGNLKRVWLSVGGAGTSTYSNIQSILEGSLKPTLLKNFSEIYNALGATGFDLDYEEYGNLPTVLTDVVVALYKELSCKFTMDAYQTSEMGAWFEALQKIYSELGIQPVVGMNLQVYEGGSANNPLTWTQILKGTPGTGVPDSDDFIWPIQSIYRDNPPSYTPSQMISNLQRWESKGGSFWNNFFFTKSDLDATMTDFSKAIAKGIS